MDSRQYDPIVDGEAIRGESSDVPAADFHWFPECADEGEFCRAGNSLLLRRLDPGLDLILQQHDDDDDEQI